MPEPTKVTAYAKDTGERLFVPEHFLPHPVLGANLSRVPTVPSSTPDETWTVPKLRKHAQDADIDLAGATSKADILAAIHNPLTPAAGASTEE